MVNDPQAATIAETAEVHRVPVLELAFDEHKALLKHADARLVLDLGLDSADEVAASATDHNFGAREVGIARFAVDEYHELIDDEQNDGVIPLEAVRPYRGAIRKQLA
jgi:hypothetical protein